MKKTEALVSIIALLAATIITVAVILLVALILLTPIAIIIYAVLENSLLFGILGITLMMVAWR